MEYEERKNYADFAKKSTAGTALGLSIGALALPFVGNILTNAGMVANGACSGNTTGHMVSHYELAQAQEIESLKSQIALRDSNTYTDSKLLDFYKYVDTKFAVVEGQLCEQKVYNATNNAVIGCIQNQVNQLMALTKMVIPIASICPQPAVATTSA